VRQLCTFVVLAASFLMVTTALDITGRSVPEATGHEPPTGTATAGAQAVISTYLSPGRPGCALTAKPLTFALLIRVSL
jgi:hypothetical protein